MRLSHPRLYFELSRIFDIKLALVGLLTFLKFTFLKFTISLHQTQHIDFEVPLKICAKMCS
jgi:hypothetical protein